MSSTTRDSIIQQHIINQDFQSVTSYSTPYQNPPAIFTNKCLWVMFNNAGIACTDTSLPGVVPLIPLEIVQQYVTDYVNREVYDYLVEVDAVNGHPIVNIEGFINIRKDI